MAQKAVQGASRRASSMRPSAAEISGSGWPLQSSGPSRQLEYVARHMHGERGRGIVQFRRAFHRCQVPMLLVDNTRRYLDANPGATLLFRLTLGELRQRRDR